MGVDTHALLCRGIAQHHRHRTLGGDVYADGAFGCRGVIIHRMAFPPLGDQTPVEPV